MGLISRVSSRTYRKISFEMADILVVGRPVTAGPRTRPEAVEIADKHVGRQMAQNLHDYNNKAFARRSYNESAVKARPTTASLVTGGGGPAGDQPAPRVKPQAEKIYQKNRGTLTQIYADYSDNIYK